METIKTSRAIFEAMEKELTKNISERDIGLFPQLQMIYGYSVFCKNNFMNENFMKNLEEYSNINFFAYYHKKHGTLKGSNIAVWDHTSPRDPSNDIKFYDHSIYKIETLKLKDYDWYSRKYPLFQQHNHLERKTQIKQMIKRNQSDGAYTYPPLIGYRNQNEIYVLEGTRRLSSILMDENQSIDEVDIFLVDIVQNADGTNSAKNLFSYISNDKDRLKIYDDMKIRSQPTVGYYIFDYAQKREFFYPDLGQQISAIIKYIMTNDKTDVASIWEQIQSIKNDYPK